MVVNELLMPIIEFEGYLFKMKNEILIEPNPEIMKGSILKLVETFNTTGRKTGRNLTYKVGKVHRNYNRIKGQTINKVDLTEIKDYDELMRKLAKSHLKIV